MTDSLNLYGDNLIKTTGAHGADISSQRMDDLDIESVVHAARHNGNSTHAVDLGCGLGMQGLRFATFGIPTLLIDQLPIELTILGKAGFDIALPISYLNKDVRCLSVNDLPGQISICYSQRFIHYLMHHEAIVLLQLMRQKMLSGSKLFLSASGLGSELGNGYRGMNQPFHERFAALSPEMATKHNIHAPVCLYKEDDLIELCAAASFLPDRVYSSSFGNVKGIFTAT